MSQSHYFHTITQSGAGLFLAHASRRTCRWCGTSTVFSRWFLAAVWSISITFAPTLSLSSYLFWHDAACWFSPPFWWSQWSRSKSKIWSCRGWIKHPAIISHHPSRPEGENEQQMWKASSIVHRFSLHYRAKPVWNRTRLSLQPEPSFNFPLPLSSILDLTMSAQFALFTPGLFFALSHMLIPGRSFCTHWLRLWMWFPNLYLLPNRVNNTSWSRCHNR